MSQSTLDTEHLILAAKRQIFLGVSLLLFIISCKKESPAPLPNANFYVDNASCSSPCYVKFFDQSYSADSWLWEFNNGVTSTYQNDSSQFANPGVYNITLTVWNADNVEDKITKQISVF
jgi:PKD repeat protein